jgi:hypothetical protein
MVTTIIWETTIWELRGVARRASRISKRVNSKGSVGSNNELDRELMLKGCGMAQIQCDSCSPSVIN